MEAFRDCSSKNDWFRDAKNKSWKSRVNWRRCDRIDALSAEQGTGPRMPDVEAEIRGIERDEIARMTVNAKLEEQEKLLMSGVDPLGS